MVVTVTGLPLTNKSTTIRTAETEEFGRLWPE